MKRTLGTERNSAGKIADYKIKLTEKPRHVYAITLADIWGGPECSAHSWNWEIDLSTAVLESKKKCKEAFRQYQEIANANGNGSVWWWSSKTYRLDTDTPNYRLLAMVYKMTQEQIDTYNWR